ncbi:DUF86 domain-containing protein [Bifidobacterium sp. MA2]|uniref:DUF86 domain-containing protein n=2 Tax=Bifidobacterium santillanense TaxID=2809028 RepID=A0ABS5UMQ4_9BIFI|nr:DUF86 domain-containing protein [Bifidobacterium santillanense]
MRDAQRFLGTLTVDEFEADDKTQNAVAMAVARAGEHVKGLSATFREHEPETEWKAIAGTRDWIVHGYDELDFGRLYYAVTKELPLVLAVLQPYIEHQSDVVIRNESPFDVPRI